eukprot:SAG31_NODE_8203_length_1497_cov_1.871245_2_plen_248_part_00
MWTFIVVTCRAVRSCDSKKNEVEHPFSGYYIGILLCHFIVNTVTREDPNFPFTDGSDAATKSSTDIAPRTCQKPSYAPGGQNIFSNTAGAIASPPHSASRSSNSFAVSSVATQMLITTKGRASSSTSISRRTCLRHNRENFLHRWALEGAALFRLGQHGAHGVKLLRRKWQTRVLATDADRRQHRSRIAGHYDHSSEAAFICGQLALLCRSLSLAQHLPTTPSAPALPRGLARSEQRRPPPRDPSVG